MERSQDFPDIYVVSKFAKLPEDLKKFLPKSVNVIPAVIPGISVTVLKLQDVVEIPESISQFLQKAEVIVADSTCLAGLLYKLPNAKWVQNTWTGVEIVLNRLDPSKPLPHFTLTRFGDSYYGDLVGNYVLAHIINAERGFFEYHDKQKLREWTRPCVLPNLRTLRDLTVGVLGSGLIGSAVGRLLKITGCRVITLVRHKRNEPSDSFDEAVTDLNAVLHECHYICNVLPSTNSTVGLLDNDVLQNCKKKPVFINVGRGDIIQSSSLIKALREGWISRAFLDVFEEEPLPSDSELWSIPKVHITPHVAAMHKNHGLAQFIAENYLKYVRGEPLRNIVNWENGY